MRRLHLFCAKFCPHPLLHKDRKFFRFTQKECQKLSVEQLKCKFAAYSAEIPILTAHKNSDIKNMCANAVSYFQIRLKMGHGEGTNINSLILYITRIFHQMLQYKEWRFISEMPAYITA